MSQSTATALAPADNEPNTQLIPAERLIAGHVVDFFGIEHRVDRFLVEQSGPVFDPERNPPRRIAVSSDGWALTLLSGQLVPVRVPTDTYQVEVYRARTPHEPVEVVPFAAESEDMAQTVARRILILLDAGWGDIHSADGVYVDTVAVS